MGIAHEDKMSAMTLARKFERQLLHPYPQTAGHRVLIWTFEGEQHEVERGRGQSGQGDHFASCGVFNANSISCSIPYPRYVCDMHVARHCATFHSSYAPQGWKGRKAWQ